MKISYTRAMVNAVLNGKLHKIPTTPHPVFGVHVPMECPRVPSQVLNPRESWDDSDAYDRQASELAKRFIANFEQFSGQVLQEIVDAGPQM